MQIYTSSEYPVCFPSQPPPSSECWVGSPGTAVTSTLVRGPNLVHGAPPSRDAAVFVLRVCKLALIRLLGNDVGSKLGQR